MPNIWKQASRAPLSRSLAVFSTRLESRSPSVWTRAPARPARPPAQEGGRKSFVEVGQQIYQDPSAERRALDRRGGVRPPFRADAVGDAVWRGAAQRGMSWRSMAQRVAATGSRGLVRARLIVMALVSIRVIVTPAMGKDMGMTMASRHYVRRVMVCCSISLRVVVQRFLVYIALHPY
jgi:hypothetical protein